MPRLFFFPKRKQAVSCGNGPHALETRYVWQNYLHVRVHYYANDTLYFFCN